MTNILIESYHFGLADLALYSNVTYSLGQVHISKVQGHGTHAYVQRLVTKFENMSA